MDDQRFLHHVIYGTGLVSLWVFLPFGTVCDEG